jgi:hypothetical protein
VKTRILGALGALAAAALIAAGCNNNGCYGCVTVSACSVPAGLKYALVYPAPSSTGVPTNLSQVIVATSGTLPSDWQTGSGWDVVLLYNAVGSYPGSVAGNIFASVNPPFPTPNATPSFSSPSYFSSSINYTTVNTPMPPGMLITAELNDLNSTCYPGVTIGTFST